jgi:PAS domain S-box-containing protein
MQPPENNPPPARTLPAWKIYLPPVLILLATALLALWIFDSRQGEQRRLFERQARRIISKVADAIGDREDALFGCSGLVALNPDITREQWEQYVAGLYAGEHPSGTRGFGYSVHVPAARLSGFLLDMQRRGQERYAVRPPGERKEYLLVAMMAPSDARNAKAPGFDQYGDAVRREAFERARDTGRASLSGMVFLSQEPEEAPLPGALLCAPVYRKGMPTGNRDERRAALQGFVVSPFRVAELLRSVAAQDLQEVGLTLRDVTPGTAHEGERLYSSLPRNDTPRFRISSTENIAGRTWAFDMAGWPSPQDLPGPQGTMPIVAMGALLAVAVFLVIRNIDSTRARAEALARRMTDELRRSEAYNRALFEHSVIPIGVGGPDGRFNDANPALLELLGYTREELLGLSWIDITHPEDRDQNMRFTEDVMQGRRDSYRQEKRYLKKNGDYVWVSVNVGVLRHENGAVRFLVGAAKDISGRKSAQAARKEREALYRAMFEDNRSVSLLVDPRTGDIKDANHAAAHYYGYPREQLQTMRIGDINTLPEDLLVQAMAAAVATGGVFHFEHRLKNGAVRNVQVHSGMFESGGQTLLLSTVLDVTDRLRAEADLSESRERFRQLVEGMEEGVVIVDPEGSIQFANRALGLMLSRDPAAVAGRSIAEFLDQDGRERLPGLLAVRRGGARESYEVHVIRADGSTFLAEVRPFPLFGQDGDFKGSCGIIADVTAQRAAQEAESQRQLRRAAQLKLHEMRSTPRQELLDYALNQALALTASPVGYICLYDDTTRLFTLHAWSAGAMDGCRIKDKPLTFPLEQTGVWGDVVRQRKSLVMNDFEAPDPAKKGWPQGHIRLTRFLSVPVVTEGRVRAVIGVGNKQGPYGEEDEAQLRMFIHGLWEVLEREEAGRELWEMTERFHLATRSGRIGLWDWEADGRAMHCDAMMEELYGMRGMGLDLTGGPEDWLCHVHPEDRERLRQTIGNALAQGGPFNAPHRVIRPDGGITHIEASGLGYLDKDRKPLRVVGVCMDATRLREAEQELAESHRLLQGLIDALPHTFCCKDENGHYLLVNKAFARMRGDGEPASFIGRAIAEFDPPDHAALHEEWDRRVLEAGPGVVMSYELTRTAPDGQPEHRIVYKSLVRLADGSSGIVAINIDNTSRKLAEERLAASEALFRSTFDHAPMGVATLSADHRYTQVNAELCRITGYAPEELLGKRFTDITHPEELERELVRTAQLESGEIDRLTTDKRYVRKDGSHVWVRLNVRLLRDDTGAPWLFLAMTQDITEQKAAETALREAKAAAEAATRSKAQFLANMSHEIRTPLAGVIGTTRLLAQTGLDGEQSRLAEMAVESGRALLTVVNDILDFSKIEAGRMSLKPAPFSLRGALESIAAPYREMALERGLALEVAVDPDAPDELVGDEPRLGQVLRNLLGNALKFTEHGGISLNAEPDTAAPPSDDAPGIEAVRIRFRVRDTGPGIDPDYLPHIFDSFSQADDSHTKQHGGTGLGLAICKNLVELMGGRIEVRSATGQGSEFHFSLDFDLAERTELPTVAETHTPYGRKDSPATGLRVLLAEDNAIGRVLMEHLLTAAGHATASVGDGQAVLETLKRQDFDVVLMDVQMPGMDGLTATRLIRQGQAGADKAQMALVALTAYAASEDRARFLAEGLDEVVAKPTEAATLEAAIHSALAAAQARADGASPSIHPEPPQESNAPAAPHPDSGPSHRFDQGFLERSFGNAPELLDTLLTQFKRESLPELMAALARHLDERDWQAAGVAAHRGRGSLGTVGALRAARLAHQVETDLRAGVDAGPAVANLLRELEQLDAVLKSGHPWGRNDTTEE